MGKNQVIEELLPGWFENTLEPEEQQQVEEWRSVSDENEKTFAEFNEVWEQTERLQVMQKYNAQNALLKVHGKIDKVGKLTVLETFKRIAAILVLPLIVASMYLYIQNTIQLPVETQWYTLKTGAGMRSHFELPDGTEVFLNSNTTLRYPGIFSDASRQVELLGEAYFDVEENKEVPFIVNTGDINVEVTGTEFKVSNYSCEKITEVVLVEGAVRLFQGTFGEQSKIFKELVPGEKATFLKEQNKLFYEQVDVAKYLAWKNGKLMFRDDSMEEVVRRLNRWYNVNIHLAGNHIGDYVYTATFEDESLIQVLDLLKISAPIDYQIKERKRKTDNTFSNMEIEIIQK